MFAMEQHGIYSMGTTSQTRQQTCSDQNFGAFMCARTLPKVVPAVDEALIGRSSLRCASNHSHLQTPLNLYIATTRSTPVMPGVATVTRSIHMFKVPKVWTPNPSEPASAACSQTTARSSHHTSLTSNTRCTFRVVGVSLPGGGMLVCSIRSRS